MHNETTDALPTGNESTSRPEQPGKRVELTGRQADEITLRRMLSRAVDVLALIVAAENEFAANGNSSSHRHLHAKGVAAARDLLPVARDELRS